MHMHVTETGKNNIFRGIKLAESPLKKGNKTTGKRSVQGRIKNRCLDTFSHNSLLKNEKIQKKRPAAIAARRSRYAFLHRFQCIIPWGCHRVKEENALLATIVNLDKETGNQTESFYRLVCRREAPSAPPLGELAARTG